MNTIDKMLTYKVNFKVALIPDGIDISDACPGIGIFKDDNVINKYLCQETESQKIIDYLNSIYEKYPNGEDIYDLIFITNGIFECKIIAENDSDECDIEDILCPDEIVNENNIIINKCKYTLDFHVEKIAVIEKEELDRLDELRILADQTYNGVIYDDAWKMEAQMKEDAKKKKNNY
jgi:hypothetical protein